jgi:hypothetical protein
MRRWCRLRQWIHCTIFVRLVGLALLLVLLYAYVRDFLIFTALMFDCSVAGYYGICSSLCVFSHSYCRTSRVTWKLYGMHRLVLVSRRHHKKLYSTLPCDLS